MHCCPVSARETRRLRMAVEEFDGDLHGRRGADGWFSSLDKSIVRCRIAGVSASAGCIDGRNS